MANIQQRRQKLTSDIDSGEFNVANKLVKIGADGKIPEALIPIVFDYGLSFYGDVSEVVDTTHFKSDDLTGKGNDFFNGYYVYVLWDDGGAGAAPQGEIQPISDYVSADGTFTHTAFTTPLEENDKVLILHPNQAQKIEVQDVIIYPVSEHAGTTEITDDGTSPAYYADTESGTATLEATPNVHWLEDINFEQLGTLSVISMYLEFEWEHKTSGGTAYSKIQISGDGGSTWVDVTDSIAETNATYQNKLRAGVGNFLSTITSGANKLQFRLVSWEAGGATSSAKIRSNSYIRLTYRKS